MGTDVITWERLVELEPRLADVHRQALAFDGTATGYCALSAFYGWARQPGLKRQLSDLVGWSRRRPEWETPPCPSVDGLINMGDLCRWAEEHWNPKRMAIQAEDMANGRECLWASMAYDVAYEHVYESLPDCGRGCWC